MASALRLAPKDSERQDALMIWQRAGRLAVILTFGWATLAWITGCSRQVVVAGSGATAGSSELPFERASDNSGISPTAGFVSEGIPAGSEVTIRLQLGLSSEHS